jgi:hypothetical protein
MKKVVLITIICFMALLLTSCTTINSSRSERPQWEYGKLVRMGDEFVAWYTPEKNFIGTDEVGYYFQKNDIEPVESEILKHLKSLGWEVVREYKTGRYTTEYQLKRLVK